MAAVKQSRNNLEVKVKQSQNSQQSKLRLHPLGGICLYNQQYQRHTEKVKHKNSLNIGNRSQIRIAPQKNKTNSAGRQDEEEEEEQLQELNLIDKMDYQKLGRPHDFVEEIQNMLSHVKHSHLNMMGLLSEIEQRNKFQPFQDIETFDELFTQYKSSNQQNFSIILHKLLKQLKQRMFFELKRIKKQSEGKLNEKRLNLISRSTQTVMRTVDKDISQLKQEIKVKEMQYNVLYDYKRNKLSRKDTYIEEMFLEEKNRCIAKLEEDIKSKDSQIKRLQKKVFEFEGKFFNKLIEHQRKDSSLLKSELSSILQYEFSEDQFRSGFKNRVKNNLISKKNRLQRESRLSLAESLLADKVRDMIASAIDVNARSRSLKEIDNFGDLDSQFSFDGNRSSKKSDKKSLAKVIQAYEQKDKVRKSSMRRNETKPRKNQSVTLISSQKQLKDKVLKALAFTEKEFIKMKQKQQRKKMSVTIPPLRNNSEPKIIINDASSLKGEESMKVMNKNQTKQKITVEIESEPKVISFKTIKGEGQPSKKIKKGVSFHLDEMLARAVLKLSSNQVSFCFSPVNQISQTRKLSIIRQLQKNQKVKNDKSKLIKIKPKEKKHFKMVSCLQPEIQTPLQSLQSSPEKIKAKSKSKIKPMTADMGRLSLNEKANPLSFQQSPERIKNFFKEQNMQEKELITKIAQKCRTKEKFYHQIQQLHQQCGEHCPHIKKYLQYFQFLKAKAARPTFKLNCENINKHISHSRSTYVRSANMPRALSKDQKAL